MRDTDFTAEQCLAFVERSPSAVSAHDRRAWLDLFASDYMIEDPVGSAPHVPPAGDGAAGEAPLAAFYDTFIAPNAIRFEVYADYVSGLRVVRDLTIEINMSPTVQVRTPMHLLYELCVEDKQLKIRRLAAHWELWPTLKQQLGAGTGAAGVAAASGMRMLRHLGLRGTLGFTSALSGIGGPGKAAARAMLEGFNEIGSSAFTVLAEGKPGVFPDPEETGLDGLAEDGGQLRFDKLIAAGQFVTATLCHQQQGRSRRGVAFFEFDGSAGRLLAVNIYLEPPG